METSFFNKQYTKEILFGYRRGAKEEGEAKTSVFIRTFSLSQMSRDQVYLGHAMARKRLNLFELAKTMQR